MVGASSKVYTYSSNNRITDLHRNKKEIQIYYLHVMTNAEYTLYGLWIFEISYLGFRSNVKRSTHVSNSVDPVQEC